MNPAESGNMESRKHYRYSVVTPVRNEAEFIEQTVESMIGQTVRPVEWIIVNDGSTDQTADIVARYAAQHPWMKLVNREDRGARKRGQGVVEAFYTGFDALTDDYDYVVKLDGDLSFEPTYFESLLQEFVSNPKLGIAGGGVYEQPDGRTWVLYIVSDQVRGATKVYRRQCFQEIGGLQPTTGWDGIDEWQARRLGWMVQSFPRPRIYHHRYTGTATGSVKSRVEEGNAAHFMGYHPLYLIARGLRHMFSRPYLVGGVAMIFGYLSAWLRRQERVPDRDLIRFIRHTQLRQLTGLLRGKPIHRHV
jgi:biofilm PGA synthesis N-glycosyltransferase PgaC